MSKLLGDTTSDLINNIGGQKIMQYYQRMTGRPCACAKRREFLNNLQLSAQRMVTRIIQPTNNTNQSIPQPIMQEQHRPPTAPVDEQ